MSFTLRDPVSENPHPRSEARVVSRHPSLGLARKALLERRAAAEVEGQRCSAYVWDEKLNSLVPEPDVGQSGIDGRLSENMV